MEVAGIRCVAHFTIKPQMMPPAVNHPEFFYGFVLLNICWQILYLFLATDPIRYRPMMLPTFLAKATGVIALTWLTLQGRISGQWTVTIMMDGAFAILFLVAFWRVGQRAGENKMPALSNQASAPIINENLSEEGI